MALGKMLRDGRSLSGHERNCCFLNTGGNRFATISAASGLDFAEDGRAMGLADWDHDGDLDVWLANRTGPRLRFMRNDCQGQANFVTFKLRGTHCNRDAIGARLELHLAQPPQHGSEKILKLIRTLHAGSGFMSQASKRIHFGVGVCSVKKLVVRWPDGGVDQFKAIRTNHHYEITQGSGQTREWTRPEEASAIVPSKLEGASTSSRSRIVITGRLPLPALDFHSIHADPSPVAGGPTLINLWSTTCLPCINELTEFTRREPELRQAGINVLALNVDELMDDPDSDLSRSKQILREVAFPFAAAAVDAESSGTLDLFHQAFLSLRRPLPVPSSFLVTGDGRIAVIYRGPVTIEQLLHDIELLNCDPEAVRNHAVPFQGKWLAKPFHADPMRHATAFLRNGFENQGAKYLETYLLAHLNKKGWGPKETWPSGERLAELCDVLANFYRLRNEPEKVVGVYRIAQRFDPDFVPALMNLGKVMIGQGKVIEGLELLQRAHRLAPSDPVVASDLAIAYAMTGRTRPAEQLFLRLLERHPETSGIRLNLGRLYFQSRRYSQAAQQLREHLKSEPNAVEALRMLSWIRVSSPVDGDRDPRMAKGYVERLARLAPRDSAELHDLVAALYAELGEFQRAIDEARRAVRFAQKQRNATSTSEIEQRLQLYLKRQRYRLR